jgi:hypothetical protein
MYLRMLLSRVFFSSYISQIDFCSGSFARLLLAMLPPVEAGDALGIHVQSEQVSSLNVLF